MDLDVERILTAALALPDAARREIVEALMTSLQAEGLPPFDESWREVIRRRTADLRAGRVASVPWEEVKRAAREKTGD